MSEDPTRSAAGARTPGADSGPVARLRELRAALLFLTGTPWQRLDAGEVARGGAFLPALGLGAGATAGALLALADRRLPHALVAAAGVALLWLASRGRLPLALGRVASAVPGGGRDAAATVAALDERRSAGTLLLALLLAVKGSALAVLGGSTLAIAVALAVMLGRWAIVVHAYGSLAAPADERAAVLVREIKFGQFGVASVTAMAATLVLSNAIGIVLLLGVASATVAGRILVHRWLGGVATTTIEAAGELAETVALLLCAGLVLLTRLVAG